MTDEYHASAIFPDDERQEIHASLNLGVCMYEADQQLRLHPEYRNPVIIRDNVIVLIKPGNEWLTPTQVKYRLKRGLLRVRRIE